MLSVPVEVPSFCRYHCPLPCLINTPHLCPQMATLFGLLPELRIPKWLFLLISQMLVASHFENLLFLGQQVQAAGRLCLEPATLWPGGPGAAPLPEDAAGAQEVGALGEGEGQAVLEPAHVDGWRAPDGARHGHQLPRPVHQGPCAFCPLLNGGRHWGVEREKKGDSEGVWGGALRRGGVFSQGSSRR